MDLLCKKVSSRGPSECVITGVACAFSSAWPSRDHAKRRGADRQTSAEPKFGWPGKARLWLFLALFESLSIAAYAAAPGVTVRGLGQPPVQLTFEELRALPSQEVDVTDEAGNPARYRGVVLADVMTRGGARLPQLRGKAMTETLRVDAADGYAVVFALAELDADFTSSLVLLCFEKDGALLNDQEGPLRLVVQNDKRHARWVRRVTELVIQPGEIREN